ncbi:hypothetical protein ACFE04_012443 [Oxalis oulophora]
MDTHIKAPKPSTPFEYVLFEGDPDHLRTVVATPTQIRPLIDPPALKLKHRIGRGPFGDVWLATHHQAADDFDEYHEVAVKMLQPLREDRTQIFVDEFEGLFLKCRELQHVCWLHGISVLNGKICIAMKYYEGSVGDRIAQLKGGKLPLPDILRYGAEAAKGILELHSVGLLILNLKPSNLLLSEHNHLVLGDIGLAYLLLESSLSDSDMALRLGTSNYMAPEQWEPEVRGPISFETDAWGFGCCIVEMLTGFPPWFGASIEEIYHSVVIKKEKPRIPSGLPPAVENIIRGCFEYDLRNRPLISDISHVFKSSQNAVYTDGEWIGLESRALTQKPTTKGQTPWYASKGRLQVDDKVCSRKSLNTHPPKTIDIPEGTVTSQDADGFVSVKIPGVHNPVRVEESKLERVTRGLTAGDWVCLKNENKPHSVGILHSVQRSGSVAVGFIGLKTLWIGDHSELQLVEPYYVGQFVRLKTNISSPHFEWPYRNGGAYATGRISHILPNGCLIVGFPGRLIFGNEFNNILADPAEVELVSFESCLGVLAKYQHAEDYHWAVRPVVVGLSIFMAMKVGVCVCGKVTSKGNSQRDKAQVHDVGQADGNATWLRSPVTIFRGVSSAAR